MEEKRIRVIALGIVAHENKLLVSECVDKVKNSTFYRPLGGGVEFGETSEAALVREFYEEMETAVTVRKKLAVLENIFTHQGRDGHEIVFVHQVDFDDTSLCERQQFAKKDGDANIVIWIPAADFLSGIQTLYPEGLVEIINDLES